ncbi:MAG: phosphoenolpyruvate--protein phosphotransferase [Verrucomicrobiales bacterium]|nr:phosphoenolpyruvate--protein phosphotransferase [Verrucomicrobiales bacterium]
MADTDQRPEEIRLRGIGVSPGIATAVLQLTGEGFEEPETRPIPRATVAVEKERLLTALTRTREQITELRKAIDQTVGADHAGIFDAHLLVLDDASVIEEVVRTIDTQLINAESAYYRVIDRYLESLRRIADPYLRERAIDIEDVARRVLKNLRWPGGPQGLRGLDLSQPSILAAHDLVPSDTVVLDRERVLGFATEAGSPTSHTAIMARSLNIPAVVAIHDLLEQVHPGAPVLIDGYHGLLILYPTEATVEEYQTLKKRERQLLKKLNKLRDAETATSDGRRITLSANIEFVEELPVVKSQGAEGVGLYRTEFFYLNEQELRSEDKQAENYTLAATALAPHGVIIRTLDVGGDKLWPERYEEPEPNPFLGWRGIRVSLARPEIFKAQLRAILRASAHGEVGVMFPFLSCIEELRGAIRLLDECKVELDRAGIPFDPDLEVGAMIEIPSAALIADAFAAEVDFFSIGSNDLIQYTTAVDRVNERVANLYQPTHPAVVRLVRDIIDAAHRHQIWAGICGEIAGDILMTPLLVGAQVDELSVGAAQILRVRRAVSQLDGNLCRDFLDEALKLSDAASIHALCRGIAEEKYPELL